MFLFSLNDGDDPQFWIASSYSSIGLSFSHHEGKRGMRGARNETEIVSRFNETRRRDEEIIRSNCWPVLLLYFRIEYSASLQSASQTGTSDLITEINAARAALPREPGLIPA